MAERAFDVVVLGAGPAGEVCAGRVANGGLEVAVVEGHLLGGECSYYACMPSKSLLRPAELLAEVKRVPGAAEATSGDLDVASALARRDEVIHDLDDSSHVGLARGEENRAVSGRRPARWRAAVRVGDDTLTARRAVVVATGSSPAMPPIDGLAEPTRGEPRGDDREAPPESLVVLGGGFVGVELAQAWRTPGLDVTLIEAEDRILSPEEPFASEQVADGLREIGVEVRTGAKAGAVRVQEASCEWSSRTATRRAASGCWSRWVASPTQTRSGSMRRASRRVKAATSRWTIS